MMYHNYYYEIASIIILIIILVAKHNFLWKCSAATRVFLAVIVFTIILCCTNICLNLGMDGILPLNDKVLILLETFYFLMYAYDLLLWIHVLSKRMNMESDKVKLFNFCVMAGITIVLVFNIGFTHVFSINKGVFVPYPFYFTVFIAYILLYLEIIMYIIANVKKMRKAVTLISLSIILFPGVCWLITSIDYHLILGGIGLTFALLAYSFTLGDEDYELLKHTIEELEQTKEMEQKYRAEIEAADRVKTLFMEKMSVEFQYPTRKVMDIGRELLESDDSDMVMYADIINENGEQLLGFVNELIEVARKEQ